MTPEERFNKEIWWILQEIKKEYLATLSGGKVSFYIRIQPKKINKDDEPIPSPDTQRKLLDKLVEWKAFGLETDSNFDIILTYNPPMKYLLKIHKERFDEIYRAYEGGGQFGLNEKNTPNTQPIIKQKSLELIAKEIGNLDSGSNLIEFLTNCGVNRDVIEYPNTKWIMVYSVLIMLATSPNPDDKETLFKIIEEASHPLMHGGDEELAKKLEDKFNKLLGYDGYTLRNYKVKKNIKEAEQDNDLDLYLKKKILVENWRDDIPHPLKELSFNNNTLEQICYSLWDLFVAENIFFGANTFPEDILVETDPRFHQEIAFNWNLIRDLDNNKDKVEDEDGFDIEILNEARIKKDIEGEINEFVVNKVDGDKIKKEKDFYPDTKFLETPSYLRNSSINYYAYKKQREFLLNLIADLYERFENEILVIKFGDIQDKNVNVLRTILALEKEGIFTIKELRNDKREWGDKDSVYVKIQLTKSKIPAIIKFVTPKKINTEKEKTDNLIAGQAQNPIPIQIVGGKMEVGGLREGFSRISGSNKVSQYKFPYKLPAGTKWDDITIKFEDDNNVFINVKRFKHYASYKDMGFIGKGKNPEPSEAWVFLRVLSKAKIAGELTINDPNAKDKYKHQKEALTEVLQNYFSIDYDPFYPYRSSTEKIGSSYKIKITLIPPPEQQNNEDKSDKKDEVREYLDEQAPQVYEE